MSIRTVLHLFVLSSAILAAVRGPVQAGSGDQPLRYGRVRAEGAAIFNLADDKGKEVGRPKKGDLVAVYKDPGNGWLEVEVPGGFAVWVFGLYLQPGLGTTDAKVLEVTRNAVNLRPAPSNDVTNFALPQRLQVGDKVRFIEQLEPEKPMAETWVHVWSPPGVHAWLKGALLDGLAAGEEGKALWGAALMALPAEQPPRAAAPRPGQASEVERKETEARAALEEARALLERERVKPTPDFDSVESALDAVVARGGAVAIEARSDQRMLVGLRQAKALEADMLRERQRRAEEAVQAQADVWSKSKEKDPLGSVFLARGVVERRTGTGGIARFYLRFGGQTTCELSCVSGRYDLSTFAGTEVGVHGSEITSRTGEVPTYEVARLEVITVR